MAGTLTTRQTSLYAADRVFASPERAFDVGLRPGPFPDQAADLLPSLLIVTRTGLAPVGDNEHVSRLVRSSCTVLQLQGAHPIESTFATVRLRQRVTKGAGSRSAGLAMAYKLLDAAQQRWRRVNAPHLVAVVRAGGVFVDGVLQERPIGPDGSEEATHERDAA